jgi:hypothetical protein
LITLEKIIKAEFQNVNLNDVVKKLAEHNLYDFLTESISLVNQHLINKEEEIRSFGVVKIDSVATSLLIKINEYLRSLGVNNQLNEKIELEYLLGNITKRILKLAIDEVPNEIKSNQLLSIQIALQDTCHLFNYNFEELSDFVQINDLILEVYVEISSKELVKNDITLANENGFPGYCCTNFGKEKLLRLFDTMRDLEITSETENLEKLFNYPSENLALKLNKSKVDFVLQFFVCLKASGFVSSNNPAFGFYQVLQCHVLEFDEIFLNGRDIQRRMDLVRKIRSWDENKELFNKRLKELV